MPYVGNGERETATYAAERDLLLTGLSYAEVAQQTGERQKTVSERNRLIHKVDIWDAFARRCEREGLPCRVPADERFCAWFTGFFDGEGCIMAMTRPCTARPQYSEFRLHIRIQIREDDGATIRYLRDNIGCGVISNHKANIATPNARPSVAWNCEKIKDLREVIVPLFDAFPLRTKKAREYALWRPLVVARYIDTMGGHSNRKGVKEEYASAFEKVIDAIRQIRHG